MSSDGFLRGVDFGSLYVEFDGSQPAIEMKGKEAEDGSAKAALTVRYRIEKLRGYTAEEHKRDERLLEELIELSLEKVKVSIIDRLMMNEFIK